MKSIKNRWWRITAVELIQDACAVKWRGFGGENNKFQSPAEARRGYVTGCKDRRRDLQSADTCGPQPSSRQPVRRHKHSSRVPRSWHWHCEEHTMFGEGAFLHPLLTDGKSWFGSLNSISELACTFPNIEETDVVYRCQNWGILLTRMHRNCINPDRPHVINTSWSADRDTAFTTLFCIDGLVWPYWRNDDIEYRD